MPPLGTLPQEIIDKVIDELGEAYRNVEHPDDSIGVAREALHASALVSKNWTGRSRTHLFSEVKITADASSPLLIPPKSLMPYVKELEIRMRAGHYRPSPSQNLLKPFHAAPITSLEIVGGALSPAKVPLIECIIALSATLHIVTFESCSLSLSLILDIALRHPDLKRLRLNSCEVKPTNSDHYLTPRLDTHPTDLELGVLPGFDVQDHNLTMAMIAQLPIRFRRLHLNYLRSPTMTRTFNTLIEANAESLSFLQVNIVTGPYWEGGSEPLFSLGDCSNLSELTLGVVEGSRFATVSSNILSTLDPKRSTRLKRITLITKCIHQWLCTGSRNPLTPGLSNLDVTLSELAGVPKSIKEKKLTLVVASMKQGRCMSFGREWLPELLPRFHELGKAHVGYRLGDSEADTDHRCFCDRGPSCLEA